MKKKLLFLATAVALLGLWGGIAAAQQYPPAAEGLTVSDSTVAPGQRLAVSGCCFAGTVDLTIESAPLFLGSTTPDASGKFSTSVTIPEGLEAGVHTIKATGQAADGSGTLVLSVVVTVTGSDEAPDALAFTGGDGTDSLIPVAVALLVVGGVLVAVVRRRTTADRSTVSA